MSKTEIIEFTVLIVWSVIFGYCTLKAIQVPPACSAAYVSFVTAIAAKAFSN